MIDPILIWLGMFVGTLIGLTGIGGGAVLTPLLILVVGVSPMHAVGTDLAFVAITKLVGAFQHQRHGTADLQLVGRLALGSVPGALLGSGLVSAIAATDAADADALFMRVLGIALIVSAGANLLCVICPSRVQDTRPEPSPMVTTGLGLAVHIPPVLVVNPESVTMRLNFQDVTPMVGHEPKPRSDLGGTHGTDRQNATGKPHDNRRFPR